MRQALLNTDLTYIKRFQSGDTDALEQIMQIESVAIKRFIKRYIRSGEIADDVFQETWVRAWRYRETLRDATRFRSWLYQISRNAIFRQLKSRNWPMDIVYFSESEDWDIVKDDSMDPRQRAQLGQWGKILNEEIKTLDKQSQEMIVLRFSSGMNLREIAEVMNVPHGTVCTKLNRSMKKLRANLESKGLSANF